MFKRERPKKKELFHVDDFFFFVLYNSKFKYWLEIQLSNGIFE